MAQNDSADILTNEDIKILFNSFPDLKRTISEQKKKTPEKISTEDITTFMSEQAKECGIERGAHRLLEGLATICAMKMHAKFSLEEKNSLKKQDIPQDLKQKNEYLLNELTKLNKKYETSLIGLNPENKSEILGKLLTLKQSSTSTLSVNKAECETIRDMNFTDAVSLLKLHNEVNELWSRKLKPEEQGELLSEENFDKFTGLTMIAGNETGKHQSLNPGYFKKTYGQRLVNGSTGDDNEVLQRLAALVRTQDALLKKATFEFAYKFPKHHNEIEKDTEFFRTNSAEIIAGLSYFPFQDNTHDVE